MELTSYQNLMNKDTTQSFKRLVELNNLFISDLNE